MIDHRLAQGELGGLDDDLNNRTLQSDAGFVLTRNSDLGSSQ